ncbi:MAG: SRPBCC domain-containing protein [Leptolyngbya sp. Prado105]|jgi:hypothetical protein|nr:SRPBCC domain-containing protein [Leptolyngbya sp. Prado105]
MINLEDSLTIAQQIDIHAPRLRVWEVLSDLAAYHHWSPNLRVDAGPPDLEIGAKAQLLASPDTPHERRFTVEIIQVSSPAFLAWRGGESSVFQGIHRFEIQEQGRNQTRLLNTESFSGEMATTILQMSRTVLEAEFSAFNEALKRRVEAIA